MASSYSATLTRAWDQNLLFSVLIELTYRCNLDCFFCYNDNNRRGRPLSLEQYRRLLHDLHDMQVMNLVLTGGEPLAHPDFFSIGAQARELGFLTRVKSNGHALRYPLARRLKNEVDPFCLDLSLHGACAETHERQTRVRGSFERLLENIEVLQDLGLRLKLNATLTRWNEQEVEAMLEIADRLGIELSFGTTVSPRDDGATHPLDIAPTAEGRLNLFRIRETRRQGRQSADRQPEPDSEKPVTKNCGAGSSGIAIDPYGDVLPCVQWRRPMGNLHDHSIDQIWRQPVWHEIRDVTVAAKTRMHERYGNKAKVANFCPGLAHSLSGDPLSVYPVLEANMEAAASVQAEAEFKE